MRRALGAAALGFGLVLVAGAFGSPSFYVPGFALLAASGFAAAYVALATRGARVLCSRQSSRVEEGETLALNVRVERGRFPFLGGDLSGAGLTAPVPLRGLQPEGVDVALSFDRRGLQTVEPAVATARDSLGLAERRLQGEPQEVLVLPRVEPVDVTAAAGGLGEGGHGGQAAAHAALELDTLRPYRAGAPASRIHWPTVARRGTVMERRLVAEVERRPLVVLDARSPDGEEALDRAVRAAASLCVALARTGGCTLMTPGQRGPSAIDQELRGWPAAHARLALVATTDDAPRGLRREHAGAVLWVVAHNGQAPPALARTRAPARYLVSPGVAGDAAFTVAGMSGRLLGRAVRRAA